MHNFLKGAIDLRDMVFGFAALANTNDVYPIDVDYSLSVNEVYINLVKKELQTCKALNVLTRARLRLNRYSAYNASRKSRCNVSFTDYRNTLELTAVVFRYVEAVSKISLMENKDDLETATHLFLR